VLCLDVPFYHVLKLHSIAFPWCVCCLPYLPCSQHNYLEQPQAALEDSFKELDSHWLEMAGLNGWDDGSTAISVLVVNRTVYVANLGDSRAVLCSGGKAIELSSDHKPSRPDERSRIESLGGRIVHYGTWRVQGVLAVTRAFGDRRLKQYVSAEPEVRTWALGEEDEFIILASDGVWDVLSSQAAVDIVRQVMDDERNGNGNGDGDGDAGYGHSGKESTCRSRLIGSSTHGNHQLKEAAKKLTNMAYAYHSMDNITSLVIDLRPYKVDTIQTS